MNRLTVKRDKLDANKAHWALSGKPFKRGGLVAYQGFRSFMACTTALLTARGSMLPTSR